MAVQLAPMPEAIVQNPAYRRAKRLFDIVVTLLLLPFICPVIALLALLICLDSRGPVFFCQRRVGQDGLVFRFFKIRSMYVNSDDAFHRAAIQQFMRGERINTNPEAVNRYKLAADRRVTRVGKHLRRFSLDELPQFLNVLRGEMSLVGPRPALPYEVELYSAHDRLRLAGKPGLTGPWQVYGRSRVPFGEMVEMDIAYLKKQSLLLDLKLLLLTLPVMLCGQGGE